MTKKKRPTGGKRAARGDKAQKGVKRPVRIRGLTALRGRQLVESINLLDHGQITELLWTVGYPLPSRKKKKPNEDDVREAIRSEVKRLLSDPDGGSFLRQEIEAAAREFAIVHEHLGETKRHALETEVQRWLRSPRGVMQVRHLKAQAVAAGLQSETTGALTDWVTDWFAREESRQDES